MIGSTVSLFSFPRLFFLFGVLGEFVCLVVDVERLLLRTLLGEPCSWVDVSVFLFFEAVDGVFSAALFVVVVVSISVGGASWVGINSFMLCCSHSANDPCRRRS